jgi:hypothetical protein
MIRPYPKPTRKKKKAAISDKKLLALWREAVIERAGHKCEYPECTVNATQLQAHHFYTKRTVAMRYNLENGLCLCPIHHTLGAFAAHKDPDFKDIIITRGVRTQEWHDNLIKQKNVITTNTPAFKLKCLEKLKPYL